MPKSNDLPLDTILEPLSLTYRELMGLGLALEAALASLCQEENAVFHDTVSFRLTQDSKYSCYGDLLEQINEKMIALAEGAKYLHESGGEPFANVTPQDFGTPK